MSSTVLRSNQVHPVHNNCGNSEIVEVRPNRSLRIYHSCGSKAKNEAQHESTGAGHLEPGENATSMHDVSVPTDGRSPEDNGKEMQQSIQTIPGLETDSEQKNSSTESQVTKSPEQTPQTKRIATASSVRFNLPNSIQDKEVEEKAAIENDKPSENDSVVMFLLHGVGGSIEVWNLQISFFEKLNYEIVAVDLIGHGLSKRPSDKESYTFREISEDILAVFDKFHKNQNVVIGHSYGCCFSTLIARYRPRFVTKLVLISGGSPCPLSPEWDFECLPLCLLSCCHHTLRNMFLKRSFYTGSYDNSVYNSAFSIPSNVLKYTMNGQDWQEGNIEFHSWIMMPTLLLHGKHDKLVSFQEVNLMNQTIPASKLVIIENAGHMVMIENSEEVNYLINEFLKPTENYATEAVH